MSRAAQCELTSRLTLSRDWFIETRTIRKKWIVKLSYSMDKTFRTTKLRLERDLHRIHGNSINSFVKAIKKAQEQYVPTTPPEAQFPTLDGTEQLLNSIGRIAIDNKNELGSPLPAPQLIEDESFSS